MSATESNRTGRTDPFSLRAQLDRRLAEFAGGPTMAEILADLDQYRRPSQVDAVALLRESRREREEQLAAIWQP